MRAHIALGVFLASLALPAAARAEDLDGHAIIDKADKVTRAKTEKDRISMIIVSSSGEKRKRELTSWFLAGEGDDNKVLVRFDAPADVKGTGLLTVVHGDSDDQWLYLPDLRKSKRIAGATKSQSFMSTDFSNYDLRTEDIPGHVYAKTGEQSLDGRACYVVEGKPKDDDKLDETGYSRRVFWVDKERFTVPKVEYYDKAGKLLKVALSEGWKQFDGLWRPAKVTMENKQEGSKTIVTYERGREVNKGVPESTFTKQALENP
ncbi:MAG TPA: outer membrane lipoprotein-sorting protein [Planctomycetota bacterium]|nr:outer membrane lipoprotein-sorting protein [Planctomycetota bacterium]